jgi:hypothetical protein
MLVRVANRLCDELGDAEAVEVSEPGRSLGGELTMSPILSAEDEALVAGITDALAKIAVALSGEPHESPPRAVLTALDGAALVTRGELVQGNAERLPQLMPSFVFLVALPIVEQDRALELSRRMSELVEEEAEI